jgi:hypothetical protein
VRSLSFQSRARRAMRPVSACDRAIGGMPGGQGWPPVAGSGASPVQICRSAGFTVVSPAWRAVPGAASGAAGRTRPPARADWTAAFLSWARAVRTVCRQIAFQVRAWDWSQPKASFPVRKVVSVGHR